MVTVGYSRLQHVTEWLQWVTAGYRRVPSGYSGLQQVTAVTEWLQWVTELLHWVTAGYSR